MRRIPALILFAAYSASAAPLPFTNVLLPAVPFLHPVPASPLVLPDGAWQLEVSWTLSNTWAHSRVLEPTFNQRPTRAPVTFEELTRLADGDGSPGLFHFDGELRQTTISLRRGLGRHLMVEVRVPLIEQGGGFLDPGIERFHAALGFDRAGRKGVDLDAFTLYLRADDRLELFVDRAPPSGLGDLGLALTRRLPVRGRWRLAARATVELPTGDEGRLLGSGSTDLAIELFAERPLGPGTLCLGLGAVRWGAVDPLTLGPQLRTTGFLAYERPFGRRWSAIGQLSTWQSQFRDLRLKDLARHAFMFQAGVSRELGDRRRLFLGASDNNFTFQSSADVGLHVALRQDW